LKQQDGETILVNTDLDWHELNILEQVKFVQKAVEKNATVNKLTAKRIKTRHDVI
jgi:hypothetical protein